MNASDYRARARLALQGKWPMAVLVGLVASLLGGGSTGVNVNLKLEQRVEVIHQISPELSAMLMVLIGVLGVFAFAYAVMMLILGSVVQLGYIRYHLRLHDGYEAQMGDLFAYFGRFVDAVVLRLLMMLFILLWSLLLVIPGVMAAYSYYMAPYILAEDPECTPMEAIRRSKAMMEGYKLDLFILDLSFIGWALLSAVTFGIGNLFLVPYVAASKAAFYRDLQHRPRMQEQQYDPYEQTDM